MAAQGEPVAPPCPECGGQAVYNGNYFCSEDDCDWALPGQDLIGSDRRWGVEAYVSLMRSRGEKPNPLYSNTEAWRY